MKNYDDAHEKNLSNYICYPCLYSGLDNYVFLTYDPMPDGSDYCDDKTKIVDRENMIEMVTKRLLVYDSSARRFSIPICLDDFGEYSRLTMIISAESHDFYIYSSEAIDGFLEDAGAPS